MEKISASVTLHVEVFDPREMWEHAKGIYETDNAGRCTKDVIHEFEEMCGTRDEPDVAECLRMIFDPGKSPPGVQIEDSFAEIHGRQNGLASSG